MKKHLAIYTILFVFCGTALAQKIKYEDDLNRILTLPIPNSIAELKQWQEIEPDEPSIPFQLAVLYEKRYRESDALVDFAYKYGNAKLALGSYWKASKAVDEKEVKKNEELYFNFGKYDEKGRLEVEYDTVANHINGNLAELTHFISNAKTIQDEFTQSFSHYDKAHKIYSGILGRFPTYKELYLLFDDEVDQQFDEIKSEYQSFLEHWENYKAAEDTFDIGYDQQIQISEISVYRLHGLQSEINFLKPIIPVWDYADWIDKTREDISSEISSLRNSLIAEDIRINKKLASAQPEFIRDEFQELQVSKEVLFNLRKYDLNSVVEPVFIYKQKKHDIIHQNLISQELESAETVDEDRKLYLYGQTINKIKLADSTLIDIVKRNTDVSYKKYKTFVDTQYKGQTGIATFVSEEQRNNASSVDESVSRIKNAIYTKLSQDTLAQTVLYKRKAIPLNVSVPTENEFLTPEAITTHRLKTFDGSYVLAGIFKNEKENKTQAYVCGVTPDKKVAWYNEYMLPQDSSAGVDSHTRIATLSFVPGGIGFILNAENALDGSHINQLMMLDETGKLTQGKRMFFSQYPRTMTFSEQRHTLFVTFKGDDFSETIFKESELIAASYNIIGDLQWQQRMTYKGDITSVFTVEDGKVIMGNYNEIKGLDGRIKRAGMRNTDSRIYALKINEEGEFTDLKTIEYVTSISGNITYKVSEDCINIFGTKGDYLSTVQLNTDPTTSIHIILNGDLEILSSSLD